MKKLFLVAWIFVLVPLYIFSETGTWNPPPTPPPANTFGSTDNFHFAVISQDEKLLDIYHFTEECPDTYTIPDTIDIEGEKYTVASLTLGSLTWENSPSYLTLPSTLRHIDKIGYDYHYWKWLCVTNLNFANSQIDTIPSYLFAYSKISEVTLSPNTKVIEEHAFHNDDLSTINFVEGLEKICDNAFVGGGYFYSEEDLEQEHDWHYETDHCRIEDIFLPKSLKELGAKNFEKCDKTDRIVLPPSLEIIRNNCFYQCVKVGRLVIPNNVKKIERMAFNCWGYYPYSYSTELKYADMTSLTLGKNLSEIEEKTFGSLPNLRNIYCFNPKPPTFRFGNVNPNATIHVPPGALLNYKNDPEWGAYFSNFVELPDIFIQSSCSNRPYEQYFKELKLGQTMKLGYTFVNFTDKKLKEGWEINGGNGLKIVNDVAIPLKEGVYRVKPILTDEIGKIYKSDDEYYLLVRGQIEGYNSIDCLPPDDIIEFDNKSLSPESTHIYTMQGLDVGNSIEQLSPGMYIVTKGLKSHKILIK